MGQSLAWSRQFHKPSAADNPTLLIFPHAGSGASTYRAFSKKLSETFDVVVFQYPGRQDRAREEAAETLPELANGALAEFSTSTFNRGGPITVFGHSMGAIVAFEFVRAAEAAGLDVRLLTVSAAVAPDCVEAQPNHPSSDDAILDHLETLNGTGAAVLGSREIMKMALPVIKKDYRAFDSYSCAAGVKVNARIHTVGGDDDPFITIADLRGWSRHSDSGVDVTVFDGGHFFLNDNIDEIAELLTPVRSTTA